MSPLSEQQMLFWRVITWPTGVGNFLAHADASTRAAFVSTFGSPDTTDAVERMTVYAESYYWRLHEALEEQYRVVAWLVGARRFRNLVTDFVWQRPSSSPDVRRWGAGLPAYLAEHALERELGGVVELAEVERAMVEAIDAPDQPSVGRATLETIDAAQWPELRFVRARHTQVLTTQRSYPRAWAACCAGEPSPDPVPAVSADARFEVVVWRHALEVFHRAVRPAQAAALRRLGEGATFAQICQAALDQDPSVQPPQIVTWLGQWIDDGLLCGVVRPSDDDESEGAQPPRE